MEMMIALNEAYAVLGKPDKRREYDRKEQFDKYRVKEHK